MSISKREQFINHVKNGGDTICSPQIGAHAGFDTKLVGKQWISDTTLEDNLSVVGQFDIVPLINVGCNFKSCIDMQWKCTKSKKNGDTITSEHILETPVGNLTRKEVETKIKGTFQTKYAIKNKEDFKVMEYYISALCDVDFTEVTNKTREISQQVGGKGALSVQWPVQPYEFFCFPDTVETVFLHNDYLERCQKIMNDIVEIDKKLFKAVALGGADFIFLGAPAAEMVSPYIYEKLIVPYSQIVTEAAHEQGLLVYSHICSPIEPFLTKGYYNQMGIDLFETLSPPPVGNIISLEDAFSKIDPNICTRGNIGLDVLLNGTTNDVREKTFEIIESAIGRKHIVAASDYMFYNTKEENVRAMADAVTEYYS
ncbi:MAG: hypothetical protein KAQ68_09840 [Clostridiales bacterium]|nr:hypothetical protein [Clostridiales bacterium]